MMANIQQAANYQEAVYHGAGASLLKSVQIAREDAQALKTDLSDIERARARTEASLVEAEQSLTAPAKGDIDGHNEGLCARSANLRTTLMSLDRAADAAQEKLLAATTEISKLTGPMERNDRLPMGFTPLEAQSEDGAVGERDASAEA